MSSTLQNLYFIEPNSGVEELPERSGQGIRFCSGPHRRNGAPARGLMSLPPPYGSYPPWGQPASGIVSSVLMNGSNVRPMSVFEAPPAGAEATVPMRHDLPGCRYLESTSRPQLSDPSKPVKI